MILTKYPNPDGQGNRNTDTESKEKTSRRLASKNCFPHKNRSKVGIHIYVSVLKFSSKVSKGARIRNRYKRVPHLTQDTNGKVTNSQ